MAMKKNVTGSWTIQAKNAATRGRLTATAFSYQANYFLLTNVTGDAVHSFDQPTVCMKVSLQVLDIQ